MIGNGSARGGGRENRGGGERRVVPTRERVVGELGDARTLHQGRQRQGRAEVRLDVALELDRRERVEPERVQGPVGVNSFGLQSKDAGNLLAEIAHELRAPVTVKLP